MTEERILAEVSKLVDKKHEEEAVRDRADVEPLRAAE